MELILNASSSGILTDAIAFWISEDRSNLESQREEDIRPRIEARLYIMPKLAGPIAFRTISTHIIKEYAFLDARTSRSGAIVVKERPHPCVVCRTRMRVLITLKSAASGEP